MNAVYFDPDARAEFLAAMEYYEGRQPGLGRRFRLAVEAELVRVHEMPFGFHVLHSSAALFGNYYETADALSLSGVSAHLHGRSPAPLSFPSNRNPFWLSRLRTPSVNPDIGR